MTTLIPSSGLAALPRHCLRAALVGLPATLGAAPAAHAQEDARAQARAHFARGVELAKSEAYAGAVVEFEKAYALSPHYSVLYNIGQARVALGDSLGASDSLSRYLADGGSAIGPERRREVEAELERQRARVAELEVESNVPGAAVFVDAEPAGTTPLPAPIRLNAGAHRVAIADGARRQEQAIALAPGQRHRLVLTLPPPSASGAASSAPPGLALPGAPDAALLEPAPSPPERERTNVQATMGYLLGGVGLALGGAALGHFFWNKNRFDRWSVQHAELQREPDPEDQRENNDLARSIDRARVVTIGLAVGAAVAVGGGVVLVVSAPPPGSGAAKGSAYRMLLQGEF